MSSLSKSTQYAVSKNSDKPINKFGGLALTVVRFEWTNGSVARQIPAANGKARVLVLIRLVT